MGSWDCVTLSLEDMGHGKTWDIEIVLQLKDYYQKFPQFRNKLVPMARSLYTKNASAQYKTGLDFQGKTYNFIGQGTFDPFELDQS